MLLLRSVVCFDPIRTDATVDELFLTKRYFQRMTHLTPLGPAPSKSDSNWRRFLVWAAITPDPRAPEAKPLPTGMTPLELANFVRRQYYKDRNYLRLKRRRWSIGAIFIRLVALGLSGAATIILGLSQLSGTAALGFALSAVVTLVTALEPFFNFRSRWVSADEALARWHRAEEELTLYTATRLDSALTIDAIAQFDQMRRDEWSRFSQDWLSDRRSGGAGPHS